MRRLRAWYRDRTFAGVAIASAALTLMVGGSIAAESKDSRAARVDTAKVPNVRATARAEARETARLRAWRKSPAGRRARARSRKAYRKLKRKPALGVARRFFRQDLERKAWRGPRLQPGERLKGYLDRSTALIDTGERDAIATGSFPFVTEGGAPVDMQLVERNGDLAPETPLIPLRISRSPREAVAVGSSEIGVAPVGGGGERGAVVADKVFYANVDTDTDLLVEPSLKGVETFTQLRSPASPEDPALDLRLPPGAKLQDVADSPGLPPGSLEIVKGKQRLVLIDPPRAIDADGASVSVSYRIDGDRVVLEVPHRSRSLRYPILVDPQFNVWEDFRGWPDSRLWQPVKVGNFASDRGFESPIAATALGGNAVGNYHHWRWPSTGTTNPPVADEPHYRDSFVYRADTSVDHNPNGTSLEEGFWPDWGWTLGGPTETLGGRTQELCIRNFCGAILGSGAPNGTDGNWFFHALKVVSSPNYWAAWTELNYAVLYLHDRWAPSVGDTAWNVNTSDWIPEGTGLTATTPVTDRGLGLREAELVKRGSGARLARTVEGCYTAVNPHDTDPGQTQWGHQTDAGPDQGDRNHQCPLSRGYVWPINSTTDLDEGTNHLGIDAYDIVSRKSDVNNNNSYLKVDRSAPSTPTPSGPMADARYVGPNPTLMTIATDDHSGVKTTELHVPAAPSFRRVKESADPPCFKSGCPRTHSTHEDPFIWNTTDFADGSYAYTVTATDPLGHAMPRPGEVRLDKTAPTLKLSGELYARRHSETTQPTLEAGDYNLHLNGRDGTSAPPPNRRDGSGMKAFQIFISKKQPDGTYKPYRGPVPSEIEPCPDGGCDLDRDWTQPRGGGPNWESDTQKCAEGNCDMDRDWTFSTRDYDAGDYKIKAVANDQVANSSSEEFVVRVGTLTQTDFSDKLGLEDWFQYHSTATGAGTRAHVNLATGNFVWHSVPVVNPGRGLSSVANLTYNSQARPGDVPLPYNQVGRGFSLGISSLTRVNEPLDVSLAYAGVITMTDPDGTRHRFTRESAGDPDSYTAPPGVHLQLRRYSATFGLPLLPGLALQDKRAWAATRPDGVTYFFDGGGWPTTIEDRNGNKLRYDYEWLTLAGTACPIRSDVNAFGQLVCKRRLRRVVDPAGVEAADPDPEQIGESGESATVSARSLVLDYATESKVAHWRLNETSGTQARDARGTNDGTYAGGYTLDEPGATFDNDRAVKFDGSTGRVTVPHAATLDLGDRLAIEAWFKRSSASGDQTLVGKGAGAYQLSITGGKLTLRKPGSGTIVQSVATPGADGLWHHVVATKDGASAKLYLDGADVSGPVTNQTLTNNTEPLHLGTNAAGEADKWNGWLDDVALYARPLAAVDVAQLYLNGGLLPSRIGKITDHAERTTLFEYNGEGYLERLTQAHGTPAERSFGFAYEKQTDELANVLVQRKLTRVTDPRGAPTDIRYQASSTPTLDDLAGRRVSSIHDRGDPGDPGAPDGSTPPSADLKSTSFSYVSGPDCNHTCTSVRDPLSTGPNDRNTEYKLDARGRMVEMQNALPAGRKGKTLLVWDGESNDDNNVVKLVEAADSHEEATTSMSYTANGQLASVVDPLGRLTTLEYRQGAGAVQLQSERKRLDGNSIDTGKKFVEDLVAITRPRQQGGGGDDTTPASPSKPWRLTVDFRGNTTQQFDPEGNLAETFFDSKGRITHEIDWRKPGATDSQSNPTNVTAYCSFDDNGLPREMWNPRGAATPTRTFPIDPSNDCATYANYNAYRTIYKYDAVGNLERVTDPRDAHSGTIDQSRTKFTTKLEYDALDRLRKESIPRDTGGSTSDVRDRTYTYDANDNLTEQTDRNTRTTVRTFTAMDLLQEERSPDVAHLGAEGTTSTGPEVTRYDYDAVEDRIKETRPEGMRSGAAADSFSIELKYDAVHQLVVQTRRSRGTVAASAQPDLVTSYAYDRRGNLIGATDPKRNATGTPEDNALNGPRRFAYEYDLADNRIASVEDPGDPSPPDNRRNLKTAYAYDANDNLESVTDPRGTVTGDENDFKTRYEYDERDMVKAKIDAVGARTEWELRPDRRALSRTDPRGVETADSADDFKTVFSYYRDGELASYTLPEASSQYPSGEGTVSFTRDAVGDPLQIKDARGHSFTNSFYDTGELKTTTRPSFWRAEPNDDGEPELSEADPIDPDPGDPSRGTEGGAAGGDPGPDGQAPQPPATDPSAIDSSLPESEGHGDFGDVEPEPMPELLPAKGTTSFAYDGEMRLTGVSETCSDCTTTLGRDALGRVTSIKRPFDFRTPSAKDFISETFEYDRHGNLRRFKDGRDNATETSYDQYDRMLTRAEPPSQRGGTETTRWTHDANGNVTLVESPKGFATPSVANDFTQRLTYDNIDRLTMREAGQWTAATDEFREKTTLEDYDGAGNARRIRSPRGNALPPSHADYAKFATTRSFDALNRVTKTTDGLGNDTTSKYDKNGNLIERSTPGSKASANASEQAQVTKWTYDGRDLPWVTTTTGATVRRTVSEYDQNGNLRRVVNPRGFDDELQLPVYADQAPQTTLPTDEQTPSSLAFNETTTHATLYEYDPDNLLTAMHLPRGDDSASAADKAHWRRDFHRDARGRVEYVNAAYEWGGDKTSRCKEHPAIGQQNLECSARTTYSYLETGWIASASEPVATDPDDGTKQEKGVSVRYGYDKSGNQTDWEVGPDGDERRLIHREFFPSGQLKERKGKFGPNDGSPLTYAYEWDQNGLLEKMTHDLKPGQRDRTTTFKYDHSDRPTETNEERVGSGSAPKDTLVDYDENGNVTNRRTDGVVPSSGTGYDGGKEMLFSYDPLDREVKAETKQDGSVKRTVRTCYYASGQRSHRGRLNGAVDPACDDLAGSSSLRAVDRFFYAADGRLSRKTRDSRADEPKDTDYSYDTNGNRTKDERGAHVFNSRNQLIKWTRAQGKKNAGKSVEYAVNGAGAVIQKKDPDISAEDGGGVYDFKLVGDRLKKVEFDPAGPAPKQTTEYKNDDFGNVKEIDPESGQSTTYDYDELERMVESKGPAESKPAKYEYDGLDRRDAKCTEYDEATDACTGVKRDYSYIGTSERLSTEAPGSGGGKTKVYDYDSGLERIGVETKPASGAATYKSYATDALGSVVGLEQEDGKVADDESYDYDPFGELQNRDGKSGDPESPTNMAEDARENPFRFQGFYYDSGVKTYDMQARSYRPEIGRFLTADRFESAAGDFNLVADPLTQSRYAFLGGNPVTDVEWDGHAMAVRKPRVYAHPGRHGGRRRAGYVKVAYAHPGRPNNLRYSAWQLTRTQRHQAARAAQQARRVGIYPTQAQLNAVIFGGAFPSQAITRQGLPTCEKNYDRRYCGRQPGGELLNDLDYVGLASGVARGLLRGSIRRGRRLIGLGPSGQKNVWDLPPLERGRKIEDELAQSDYAGWFHAGKELDKGYFPVIDFQKGRNLVSLKTVEPDRYGAMRDLRRHIRRLGDAHRVSGRQASVYLDVRVPKGYRGQLDGLIPYGTGRGIGVRISEYP